MISHGGVTAGEPDNHPEISLANAAQLLASGDLVGAKTFALRALDVDPLVAGADHLLAIIEVLLAADIDGFEHQVDWYSVLQLDPHSDSSAIRRQFRRLVLLLRPDINHLPFAAVAYKIVLDGWSVLSDPTKKSIYDSERRVSSPPASVSTPPRAVELGFWAVCSSCRYLHNCESSSDGRYIRCHSCMRPFRAIALPTFWTGCRSCFHVYEYDCAYEGKTLRCQTCHREFQATVLKAVPSIVPGTDSYFCSWGFYPLGFECNNGAWNDFYSSPPKWESNQTRPPPKAKKVMKGRKEGNLGSRKRKVVVKKRGRKKARRKYPVSRHRRRNGGWADTTSESSESSESIDINTEWENS
ncbi:hypothetical protein HPP92_015761 [Vanilla planifolia]|uniref:J domain-containing protein n=1 Tax=Vanilla planifolia TaxID=51239 RepID=A0A835QDK5_VANPL|nr:hypothetical protein HPP92_015761 [Vanilla planifolia]